MAKDNTTLLLVGGAAAFLFLTPQGQALMGGGGQAAQLPAGVPTGSQRLTNGQWLTPTGQVLGTPYAGYQPAQVSTGGQLIGAAIAAAPTILGWFARLFGGTAGGTGGGGATGSPGTGGGASIPGGNGGLPSDGSIWGGSGADVSGPTTIILGDGTPLELGGADALSLSPLWQGATDTIPSWW